MKTLYNLARVNTSTTGTGTITLGSAVSGFLTFAEAGVPNAALVSYAISDGLNSWAGNGVYTASGATLTRTFTSRSTGSGNNTDISLSGSAQVFITPNSDDFTATGTGLVVLQTMPTLINDVIFDGSANGAGVNLRLLGNGGTTPSKYFRVYNGNLAILNSDYTLELATLTDAGLWTVISLQSMDSTFILRSGLTITGGGTGSAPTLTAGPVAGNPTKWLPYNDNGTTRYIPSW